MAMNIKDNETEQMVAELAARTGESKTAAVRESVRERIDRLDAEEAKAVKLRTRSLRRFMEDEIWPHIPAELRGKETTKAEIEEILGYGPGGV